ncbi:hypothetical protein MVES_003076 [Malassezia vespertilionis]|uniref:C2H2-type domain-containing protein n=2 Tax=Malassezia vespertilionis TaxID=2020962 RepID=A0A2N1J9G3_9BASI|nr:hypothetical protein MVES_003076 [Malassezia vespertilionis]
MKPHHDPLLYFQPGRSISGSYLTDTAAQTPPMRDPYMIPLLLHLGLDSVDAEEQYALDADSSPQDADTSTDGPMLFRELRPGMEDPTWGESDLFSAELDGPVSGLSLDTPSQHTSPAKEGLPSDLSAHPSLLGSPVPRTPIRQRTPPPSATTPPQPLLVSPDDKTPVPSDSALLFELGPHSLPPMTPTASQATPTSRGAFFPTHRSGASISSTMSNSTPEYGSAPSIASSADLRSPNFPIDHLSMSPHRMPTSLSGNDMHTLMHQQFSPQQHFLRSGSMVLGEPFSTPEQYTTSLGNTPSMPNLALYGEAFHGKSMSRINSAPPVHAQLPWGPHELYNDPVNTSPSAAGRTLPLSSIALARKQYTPYAKAHGAILYGSPSEIDGCFSPTMPSSKSMNAISSPENMSPVPVDARRASLISHSVSMPGDQMAAMLEYDAVQPPSQRIVRTRVGAAPPLVVSSADKMHVCHCGRRFKRMEHLKRHNRTHTQERPHRCPVENCAKSFGRSDNLAQHIKTHYKGTPSALGRSRLHAFPSDTQERAQAQAQQREALGTPASAASVSAASAAAAAAASASASARTDAPKQSA